jgi:fucose 4-O-acetylase-like acetyltransferase
MDCCAHTTIDIPDSITFISLITDNYPNNLHSADIQPPTSYYGALVALAVVAALSIIGVIALLMILIKKQSYAKAAINDRKSESSYDNPSFKVISLT